MNLTFGTGGLRATMAPGPDHLNIETIQEATLGVAAYAKTLTASPSVAIGYDSRKNSKNFARETARVLALEGCRVHLYPRLMPTPALSFAVRRLKCDLGIVITASHNPKDYNGYKVYGADGGQITSEAAKNIRKKIAAASIDHLQNAESFEAFLQKGTITFIPEDVPNAFLQEILKLRTSSRQLNDLRIVYTPLNGAGRECITNILSAIGIRQLFVVPEQEAPDGDFPTCPYPNPEEDDALTLGLQWCRKKNADLLLATDPDSDRIGVAAKKDGSYRRLSGNQLGVLLLDYLFRWHEAQNTMPENPLVLKTIVTTFMAEKIAAHYGAEVINTLTGFKYIGEQLGLLEKNRQDDRYILGFEESCGYLIGSYVRDKDAVGAAMLVCEMADACKSEGKTLWDRLEELYALYGRYETTLETYRFEAEEAKRYMETLRTDLREHLPVSLSQSTVVRCTDYADGIEGLPKSNVLKLWMADGEEIVVRPSGTEPKIKIYREKQA